MRETDAAIYLGVSVRSLHRYRKAGKLAFRQVQNGPGRPYIDYDERELARFKTQLAGAASTPGGQGRTGSPKPRVSFTLSRSEYAELQEEATRYGTQPSDYARRLLREGLESRLRQEAEVVRREGQALRTEVKRLRAEMVGAFEVVLELVGVPPEDAKQWLAQNLR